MIISISLLWKGQQCQEALAANDAIEAASVPPGLKRIGPAHISLHHSLPAK